jgi:nucleotide-binding universal stress UspA family protein
MEEGDVMEKVVVSVDGSEESRAAVAWCAEHLHHDDEVVAVGGLGELGEFVMNLPGFVRAASPDHIRQVFRDVWCAPFRSADLRWTPMFTHHTQARALGEAIDELRPDLVVLGKPPHLALDVLLRGRLQHVLHEASCPVVLVPAASSAASPDELPAGRNLLSDSP